MTTSPRFRTSNYSYCQSAICHVKLCVQNQFLFDIRIRTIHNGIAVCYATLPPLSYPLNLSLCLSVCLYLSLCVSVINISLVMLFGNMRISCKQIQNTDNRYRKNRPDDSHLRETKSCLTAVSLFVSPSVCACASSPSVWFFTHIMRYTRVCTEYRPYLVTPRHFDNDTWCITRVATPVYEMLSWCFNLNWIEI